MYNSESETKDLNLESNQAQELMLRAEHHSLELRFDEALADLDKAIEIMERLLREGKLHDEIDIAHARTCRASVFGNLNRYTEALADYDCAIEIRERLLREGKLHDDESLAMGCYVKANGFLNMGLYDKAIVNYDKAIEIWQRLWAEGKLHDHSMIEDAICRRDAAHSGKTIV